MGNESVLRTLLGVKTITYQPEETDAPVTVEVRAITVEGFIALSDAVGSAVVELFTPGVGRDSLVRIIAASATKLVDVIEPFVSVPDAPDMKLRKLPERLLADVLSVVVEGISLGKWEALGRSVSEKFGLEALIEEATSAGKKVVGS